VEGLANLTSHTIVPCKRKISEHSVSPTDPGSRHRPNFSTNSLHPPPNVDNAKFYVCQTCQISFTAEEHPEDHAQSHSKESSFECPKCSSSFATQDLLLPHHQEFHANNSLSNPSSSCEAEPSQLSGTQLSEKAGSSLPTKEAISSSEGLEDNSYWMKMYDRQTSFGTPDRIRSASIHSGASTGLHHQDFIFDSNSVYSGSQASVTSAASGRRGPLNDWARAGMNAVKKVGACWRCKFLRKIVSIDFTSSGS
jgi:DNA-directed RNA polymerase subunit RPC12/RpoP